MQIDKRFTGLYTDFYELTMAQGYFFNGMKDVTAVFDYFFRKMPFKGGYVIFAGLDELLDVLTEIKYDDESLEYLKTQGFRDEFLSYLEHFRFSGTIRSSREGEVVFANEPVLIVEGDIIESQIVETLILNALNYPSLVATKASRIRQVAGNRSFLDFGMRRAHGTGTMQGSRAAVVGGANGTSNVLAGKLYGVQVSGTQAHSWVQSFDDELTAFRKFAEAFPENTILLVDTYDTLKSGIPNAITVAREMEAMGHKLFGVRLDSGDLAYLSKKSRKMLDEAGLEYVKILASNQLDEHIIKSLQDQGARIDGFGVGTRLITGAPDAALDGVYKLAWSEGKDRLKVSENVEKISLPGKKQTFRLLDNKGRFVADAVSVLGEDVFDRIYHPYLGGKHTDCRSLEKEPLLKVVMKQGERNSETASLDDIRDYAAQRLEKLPEEHKRFDNPHVYRVGITKHLKEKKDELVRHYSK
jgi:nicotinate phosphoribosyltransferase